MKVQISFILKCALSISVLSMFFYTNVYGQSSTLHPEHPMFTTTVAGDGGSTTSITSWKIQNSARVQEGGRIISRASYEAKGWYPVSARSTVFAGLIENGRYSHILRGNNLRQYRATHISSNPFATPWWYRTKFRVHDDSLYTFIKIKGIIPNADVWLDGMKLVNHHEIAGAFTVHTLNVTRLVHPGVNVLAIRVYPASARRDLIMGWWDWNPSPPDRGMGVWRNVDILRSGVVSLHGAHVLSKLALPGMKTAELTIKVHARNNSDRPVKAKVSGQVAGVTLSRTVHLLPHEDHVVTFDSTTNRGLKLRHPRVWWPAGWGKHPLYHMSLVARVGGTVSDSAHATFGIRSVTSHLTKQGYRQFVVNGKPLLIRGAAWTPDMFLRDRSGRLKTIFRYVRNIGLNAIRLEGKLDRQDFYNIADSSGIMILPGWECCTEWEAWAKTGGAPWTAATRKVARQSMVSEARLLRNHPSVIAFNLGSDNNPPPPLAKMFANALHQADWSDPISSAAPGTIASIGPSGVRHGPYAWVPPNYWYADTLGGAFGFVTETDPGVDIPRLNILKKMMTPTALDSLWTSPNAKPFHAEPIGASIPRLKVFYPALTHRYGKPRSLADYVQKAQLDNYATARAEFEAYNAHMNAASPSTGVIYWMLNNAWPSLHGHLIGYYLDPAGAYFGAKKANEPVHIQYSYDDRSIMVVNHTRQAKKDLSVHVRIYNIDGSVRYNKQLTHVKVAANHTVKLLIVPKPKGLSTTYFLELTLSGLDGKRVSRNVYWLSTRPDVLNWNKSKWYLYARFSLC
jgi:exo-1,4-beta-D-glucosaminidase